MIIDVFRNVTTRNRGPIKRMNNSNSSSNPASYRTTLRLKTGAQKSPRDTKRAPTPMPRDNSKLKPGGRWSDNYWERMQADMDALLR